MTKKFRAFTVRILITQYGLRLVQPLRKLKMRLVASLKLGSNFCLTEALRA